MGRGSLLGVKMGRLGFGMRGVSSVVRWLVSCFMARHCLAALLFGKGMELFCGWCAITNTCILYFGLSLRCWRERSFDGHELAESDVLSAIAFLMYSLLLFLTSHSKLNAVLINYNLIPGCPHPHQVLLILALQSRAHLVSPNQTGGDGSRPSETEEGRDPDKGDKKSCLETYRDLVQMQADLFDKQASLLSARWNDPDPAEGLNWFSECLKSNMMEGCCLSQYQFRTLAGFEAGQTDAGDSS
jgi:hypothetical protein